MWGVLFFLAAGAAVGLLVWNHHRKMQEREALSKARFEEIFKNERAGAPAAADPAITAPKPASPALVEPAGASKRLLTQPETLVYFLLRAAMPDHIVFAKVPLPTVTGEAGGPAAQSGARRPAPVLDFVVCDKSMRVTAVVHLAGVAGPGAVGAPGPDAIVAQRHLTAAGVRFTTIDLARMPSRSEVRARILGDASSSNA